MKRIVIVFLFIASCKNEAHKEQSTQVVDSTIVKSRTAVDSLATSVKEAQDRMFFILDIRQKRDSFLFKKYENEVLYYQTGDDKYRRRCNRMIDSNNKYVAIMDSVAKQIK